MQAPLPFLTALLLLAPQTAFHPHCCAFLAKTAEPAKLLSDIFGVASSDKVQQSMQVILCLAAVAAAAYLQTTLHICLTVYVVHSFLVS
jgi:hypothetical protein